MPTTERACSERAERVESVKSRLKTREILTSRLKCEELKTYNIFMQLYQSISLRRPLLSVNTYLS